MLHIKYRNGIMDIKRNNNNNNRKIMIIDDDIDITNYYQHF